MRDGELLRRSNRDEFSSKVKDSLGKRVNFRCSNPTCRRPTLGPKADNAGGSINIGVAAHIHAAAPGGPRFNAYMSSDERGAITNGIWLCQVCAKLVDSDEPRYGVGQLQKWKVDAEDEAISNLQKAGPQTGAANPFLVINLADSSRSSWIETEHPHRFPGRPACSMGTEFYRNFRLQDLAAYADPSFDVVFQAQSYCVLSDIGIQIVKVAHHMMGYGNPEPSKIQLSERYVLEVPNLRSRVMKDPRYLEPLDVDEQYLLPLADPLQMPTESVYRYQILLRGYIDKVPNFSTIRLLARTNKGICASPPIHIFTL